MRVEALLSSVMLISQGNCFYYQAENHIIYFYLLYLFQETLHLYSLSRLWILSEPGYHV